MKMRKIKDDDQKNAQIARGLLIDFLSGHPEIEESIFISAMLDIVAQTYFLSGFPYEKFQNSMSEFVRYALKAWNKKE